MTISVEFLLSLARLLTSYLDGSRSFGEVEALLSATVCTSADERELLRRIYHVLSHFETDGDLRQHSEGYRATSSHKLRAIAMSLESASLTEVQKSINAFWGRTEQPEKTGSVRPY